MKKYVVVIGLLFVLISCKNRQKSIESEGDMSEEMEETETVTIKEEHYSTTTVIETEKEEVVLSEQQQMHKEKMNELYSKLNLTEEQRKTFDEIQVRYKARTKQIQEAHPDNQQARIRDMQNLAKEKDAETKALLNDNQWTIYSEWLDEMREERRERRLNR